jgi:hypothetical protein
MPMLQMSDESDRAERQRERDIAEFTSKCANKKSARWSLANHRQSKSDNGMLNSINRRRLNSNEAQITNSFLKHFL